MIINQIHTTVLTCTSFFSKQEKGSTSAKTPPTVETSFHADQHEATTSIAHKNNKHHDDVAANRDSVDCEDSSFLGHKMSRKVDDTADLIDKISRALFPLIFVIFNIVYWCYYSFTN